jgi:hypothetical protein
MIGDDTVILETVNPRLALAQQGSKIIGLLQPVAFSAIRAIFFRRLIASVRPGIECSRRGRF